MATPSPQITLGILEEIQAQVELERAKRMKLEAQVEKARTRKQEQETRNLRRRPSRSSIENEYEHQYTALQTQVEGYRQIMEALTTERPAIAAAIVRQKKHPSTANAILPLQLVRLLELIPWNASVQERANVRDAVYEWQRFDPLLKDWRGDLKSFPDFFHALPVTTSPHGDDIEHHNQEHDDSGEEEDCSEVSVRERRTSLPRGSTVALTINAGKTPFDFPSFLAGLLPSRTAEKTNLIPRKEQMVLTNANLTQRFVLNAEDGYPLPNPAVSGTWRWIGRWNIDRPVMPSHPKGQLLPEPMPLHKSIINFFDPKSEEEEEETAVETKQQNSLCDQEGWTYAKEASHFVLWNAQALCWGDARVFCSCSSQTKEEAPTTEAHAAVCIPCQHRRKPVLRRRKWTRERVLVDYPMASESSLEYLRLAAHNATMRLAAQELVARFAETSETNKHVQDHWKRAQKSRKTRLEQYQSTWEQQEERIKQLRYGKFKRKIEELACNQDDILPIIANPDLFKKLQKALRQSGAITNAMLTQDHVRPVHGKSPRRKSSCSSSGFVFGSDARRPLNRRGTTNA